jgi:hypothetical protein
LGETPYAGRTKVIAEASELFTQAVSQLDIVFQKGVAMINCVKNMEVEGS